MISEVSVHSRGDLRCTVNGYRGHTTASLHLKDKEPTDARVVLYLRNATEIAAFQALSRALAAHDAPAHTDQGAPI